MKQSSTDSEENDTVMSSLSRTMAKMNGSAKNHEEMTNQALSELDEMKSNMNNGSGSKKRQYLLGVQETPK